MARRIVNLVMTTSQPLSPRAQRAFARTEKAVAAARADFAAAQSALQKALARGVDVEATLSQATDVIAEVPGTPLPKTLGPEEAAVERGYSNTNYTISNSGVNTPLRRSIAMALAGFAF